MRHLGIDHPLVAVRDIEAARGAYEALGFRMTAVGRHPWGTSTSLAVFQDSLIELISIGDESLLDTYAAGEFRFGRVVEAHLKEREGISLIALNSRDAEADAERLRARGVPFQGFVRFGRDVTLPNGERERISATLAIFESRDLPRLSAFACQQHRRDLLEVADWMRHPNGCTGYAGVTILAQRRRFDEVRRRLAGLFGDDALFETPDGFGCHTARGDFWVKDRDGAQRDLGPLPAEVTAADEPACVALHFHVPSLARVTPFLNAAGVDHRRNAEGIVLAEPERFGNVVLAFQETQG